MEDSKEEIINVMMKDNKLPNGEKELFITFLNNVSEGNLLQIGRVFKEKPEEAERFWMALKSKIIFLKKVESNKSFSNEIKTNIVNQIAGMSEEEFNTGVKNAIKIEDKVSREEKIKELLRDEKKLHEEFMTLADKFLKEKVY